MSLCLVDIHGDIEGDYEEIKCIGDNPTNGDMIKAMFTGVVVIERTHFVNVYLSDRDFWMAELWASFDLDWWNAPYKPQAKAKEDGCITWEDFESEGVNDSKTNNVVMSHTIQKV